MTNLFQSCSFTIIEQYLPRNEELRLRLLNKEYVRHICRLKPYYLKNNQEYLFGKFVEVKSLYGCHIWTNAPWYRSNIVDDVEYTEVFLPINIADSVDEFSIYRGELLNLIKITFGRRGILNSSEKMWLCKSFVNKQIAKCKWSTEQRKYIIYVGNSEFDEHDTDSVVRSIKEFIRLIN